MDAKSRKSWFSRFFIWRSFNKRTRVYFDSARCVVKRIALIKNQGEKCELGGKKMEEIVFSASLALKKFSASFITNIVNEKISDVETGLNIIRQEQY